MQNLSERRNTVSRRPNTRVWHVSKKMSEEDEDCIILEVTDEMREKRRLYAQKVSYRKIDSIKNTTCQHRVSLFHCSSTNCRNPAIASQPIFSGPVKRLVMHEVLYCEKHLLSELRSTKKDGEEKHFSLLKCSFCYREELTICCDCSIVFQVPYDAGCSYCPDCRDVCS